MKKEWMLYVPYWILVPCIAMWFQPYTIWSIIMSMIAMFHMGVVVGAKTGILK